MNRYQITGIIHIHIGMNECVKERERESSLDRPHGQFNFKLQAFGWLQGENSLFEVHVVGPIAADFEVVPSTVQSSADLVVRVKNGSLLDYEDRTHLSIKVSIDIE